MKRSPLIIGHRGASADAPENTLAAFQLAIDDGADGVEFDVQLSKDGIPVIIHDATLTRVGLRGDKVADLTADQLASIDVGSWFNARFRDRAKRDYSGETVPTLEQLLALLSSFDGLIYIELKVNVPDYASLAAAVCEVIRDSPQLSQMIVKSFKLAAIPEVRRLLPDVQTAALFEPSINTVLRRPNYMIAMTREFGAHQISLHHSLASAKLTSLAAEAEMPITIWTADDPKWIGRCRQRGIGSLITNDPKKLIAISDQ
jgi:glycerophosphoryl diester phosphodiesterase